MKNTFSVILLAFVTFCAILSFSAPASADEIKMVGVITRIDIAGNSAKTATATLKDTKTDKLVVITINDDLTLDKFKDHRIVVGDEIRCKYEVVGGKNVAKLFRKTAGC